MLVFRIRRDAARCVWPRVIAAFGHAGGLDIRGWDGLVMSAKSQRDDSEPNVSVGWAPLAPAQSVGSHSSWRHGGTDPMGRGHRGGPMFRGTVAIVVAAL